MRLDDRVSLKKELDDHMETLSVRVKSIQKQEKSLSERYDQFGEKIQQALGGGATPPSSGDT